MAKALSNPAIKVSHHSASTGTTPGSVQSSHSDYGLSKHRSLFRNARVYICPHYTSFLPLSQRHFGHSSQPQAFDGENLVLELRLELLLS